VHVLAAAFEHVIDRIPDARLSIIGPPGLLPFSSVRLLSSDEYGASLRRFYGHGLAQQILRQILRGRRSYLSDIVSLLSRRASARVSIAGAQDYQDVPQICRRASVLAAPSVLPEPFGLPLAEALASGLPVVASRAGGMPEIVDDGITGRLVQRNDVDGLADALCEILSDDSLAARMRLAARSAAVERLGWERVAARLEDVYERVTAVRPLAAIHTEPTAPERVTPDCNRAAHT
jgi:glycosyltransferase involved in cell wall biosynthesis